MMMSSIKWSSLFHFHSSVSECWCIVLFSFFRWAQKNGNETMFIPPLCRLNLLTPQNHWTEKENSVHHKNKLGQHKCIRHVLSAAISWTPRLIDDHIRTILDSMKKITGLHKCINCYFVNNTPDWWSHKIFQVLPLTDFSRGAPGCSKEPPSVFRPIL